MEPFLFLLVFGQISFSMSEDPVYHFINKNKTWLQAQDYCRKYYTDLATVDHMTDLERLRAAVKGGDAWIGLHQTSALLSYRKWHWSQPGVKYNEGGAQWRQGPYNEPTDDGKTGATLENCVVINNNGLWIDTSCVSTRSCFICYNVSSNAKIFPVITEKKTWLEAQKFCRENHTNLISGTDQLNLTGTFLAQHNECWIGLFRDTWGWSDSSESSVRVWDQWENVLINNPNNTKKKCANMGPDGQMRLESCNETKPFICYDDLILVKENKTWEEALYHCRRHYHDLAWFIDHTHLKRMAQEKAKMADSDAVWVGLHYTCFLEAWIWVNGHYVSDTDKNWKDPGESECGVAGAMERGGANQWVKKKSWDKYNFICVRK